MIDCISMMDTCWKCVAISCTLMLCISGNLQGADRLVAFRMQRHFSMAAIVDRDLDL